MGIRFLANRAEFFVGTQKLLSIDCWCEISVMVLSLHFDFRGSFWRENGRGRYAGA